MKDWLLCPENQEWDKNVWQQDKDVFSHHFHFNIVPEASPIAEGSKNK